MNPSSSRDSCQMNGSRSAERLRFKTYVKIVNGNVIIMAMLRCMSDEAVVSSMG